ncbi:hypothetical protein J4421_06275 [Candidatus Woesearchaeota archaeon]|nr:hypothetical protein [Candidatus Woesearchaeota archaeon]
MDPEDSSLEQKVSNYGLSPSSERVVDVIIDYRHVASSLATFLQERGYAPGRFNVKKTGTKFSRTVEGHFEINSRGDKRRKVAVTITKHLFDGYTATVEDESTPYICPADVKYEFKFLKRGVARESAEGTFHFCQDSIFVSYHQKDKNGEDESWVLKLMYGQNKRELRKLYETMPEMKHAVNRHLLDLVAETVLRFTTLARVIQNVGGDAWYLWLTGASTVSKIPAERFYSKTAAEVTSGLPLAFYLRMIESPRTVINQLIERSDVASWHRLEETMELLASEAELTEEEAAISRKVLKLEHLLKQPNSQEKVNEEVRRWNLGSSPQLQEALNEITLIDYESIRKQLRGYLSELEARGLVKSEISLDDIVDNSMKLFPGRYASELRRQISEMLKGIIRQPAQEEYGQVLRNVKHHLNTNIRSDMTIFLGNYPLAYLADSHWQIPIPGFVAYYFLLETADYVNHSGFERLNTVVDLHYVLKELDNDPAISSGADVINQYRSHLTRVSAGLYPLLLLIAGAGQYFSTRTNGFTNYVTDMFAFLAKYAGMKQWHKFMNALIERCEKELTEESKSD